MRKKIIRQNFHCFQRMQYSSSLRLKCMRHASLEMVSFALTKWYTDREAVYVTFFYWCKCREYTCKNQRLFNSVFLLLFSPLSVSHRTLYINYKSYGYFWCCTNFSLWMPIFFNKMHYLVNFVCIFILWQKKISYSYKN